MDSGSFAVSQGDAEAPLQLLKPPFLPLSPQLLKSHFQGFLKICLPHQPLPRTCSSLPSPFFWALYSHRSKTQCGPKQSSEGKGREERAGKLDHSLVGGRGQRSITHLLVIFIQTQLSPSSFFSSLPQCSLFSFSPLVFPSRLCSFFCFLYLFLTLFVYLSPSSSGDSCILLQRAEAGRSRRRTEGHGFWQPTEINLSPSLPLSIHSRMSKTSLFLFPAISVVSTSQLLPWAPVETLLLPLPP